MLSSLSLWCKLSSLSSHFFALLSPPLLSLSLTCILRVRPWRNLLRAQPKPASKTEDGGHVGAGSDAEVGGALLPDARHGPVPLRPLPPNPTPFFLSSSLLSHASPRPLHPQPYTPAGRSTGRAPLPSQLTRDACAGQPLGSIGGTPTSRAWARFLPRACWQRSASWCAR